MPPTAIRSSCPSGCASLIAGHIGVSDEQMVIGAGATGVVMQVLHAVTSPGDTHGDDVADVRRVPDLRADGAAGVGHRAAGRARPPRPRRHGRRGQPRRGSWWCAGRTTRPARSSPPPISSGSCGGCRPDTRGAAGRGICGVPVAGTPDRRAGRSSSGIPNVVVRADILEGLRAGRAADRLRLLRARAGPQAVDDAAAVRDRHHRPGGGRGLLRRGKPNCGNASG